MNPEAELLAGIRAGDTHAFESLVRQYGSRMLAVGRRFFSNDEDSADAVQDSAAYQSIASFEGNSKLWTWLYRILVNHCLAIHRSRYRQAMVSLEGLPRNTVEYARSTMPGRVWSEPAEARAERAETQALIRDCIERLPKLYRDVLFHRDIEELGTGQVAQQLGTSRGTVRVRLHRARLMLRTRLEPLLHMQCIRRAL
jgi:RNA polymerase sigma-70 factor (ECF subfamily)